MLPSASIGRPEPIEIVPFQQRYVEQIKGDDLLSLLEQQRSEALALLSRYTEESSLLPYAPGKWTLRQTLGHINDTERILSFRALWLARGLGSSLPSFDQDQAASAAESDTLSWAAHLENFEHIRRSTLSLFHTMPSTAWTRSGTVCEHPTVTVRALAFVIVGHVEHHLTILREHLF